MHSWKCPILVAEILDFVCSAVESFVVQAVTSHAEKDDSEASIQKVVFVAYMKEEQETLKAQIDALQASRDKSFL